jgi:hypothetical protein
MFVFQGNGLPLKLRDLNEPYLTLVQWFVIDEIHLFGRNTKKKR